MEGNLYLNKKQFGRNEICCEKDNHNNMSNMFEKEFSDSNFKKEVIGKYRFFKKWSQISHIHKALIFASVIVIFQTNCFYRTKFMAVALEEYSVSILPAVSC